ncbi:unnamed protein product, partial [Staurois parvus]
MPILLTSNARMQVTAAVHVTLKKLVMAAAIFPSVQVPFKVST